MSLAILCNFSNSHSGWLIIPGHWGLFLPLVNHPCVSHFQGFPEAFVACFFGHQQNPFTSLRRPVTFFPTHPLAGLKSVAWNVFGFWFWIFFLPGSMWYLPILLEKTGNSLPLSFLSMAIITLLLSCHPQICTPLLSKQLKHFHSCGKYLFPDCACGFSSKFTLFFHIFPGVRQSELKPLPMMWENHGFVQWQNSSLLSTSFPVLPNTWVTFQAAAGHQPNVVIDPDYQGFQFRVLLIPHEVIPRCSRLFCFFPFWYILPEVYCAGARDTEILQSCQYEWKLLYGMDSSVRNFYLYANTEKENPCLSHYSL